MTKKKGNQSASTVADERSEVHSNGSVKKMPQKQAQASSSGGGMGFQLFIFFIATSSIALNVAIIYGLVPIKGITR